LVVDAEPAIQRLVCARLTEAAYATVAATTVMAGLDAVSRHAPDLILLDLNLPDMDGMEFIRQLRAGAVMTPIIVLSSRDDEQVKVTALDLGADDYVTKPFGLDELCARIRTGLRHRLQLHSEAVILRVGDLTVDLARRLVVVRGARVSLSPHEYDLLGLLIKHAGKVLTHKFIQANVWGRDVGVQYVRIYIRSLRMKIEEIPAVPKYIFTQSGVGYWINPPD
jgi:two-component system, OmpR family, KDP operon response regulator KdpE